MSAVGRWWKGLFRRPARQSPKSGSPKSGSPKSEVRGPKFESPKSESPKSEVRESRPGSRSGEPSARRAATERLGAWGEEVAARHLEAEGYRIVERRRREGRGELDLIAVGTDRAGAFVAFVEVKTRSSEAFGGPEAGMDRRKRNALRRSAMHYLRRLPGAMPRFRFDLVAVVGSPDSATPPTVRHETDVMRFDPRVQVEWARRVR